MGFFPRDSLDLGVCHDPLLNPRLPLSLLTSVDRIGRAKRPWVVMDYRLMSRCVSTPGPAPFHNNVVPGTSHILASSLSFRLRRIVTRRSTDTVECLIVNSDLIRTLPRVTLFNSKSLRFYLGLYIVIGFIYTRELLYLALGVPE
jgi:hypothetical protein